MADTESVAQIVTVSPSSTAAPEVAVQRPDPDAGAGGDGLECHILAFLGEDWGVLADDQHQVREVTDSRGATVPDVPSTETSRIHIPRPSRIGKSIDSRRDDGDSIPVQLALEAAAA
jgi:hypothetical protein